MQTQIKTLSEQGYSIRSIARILRLSRRTVRKYLEPTAQPPSEGGGWVETVDWDYVRQEVYGKGMRSPGCVATFKNGQRAMGRVDRAPSHAATSARERPT